MRKKRNKSKKVQLALTYIALWRIEAAPFSDTSDDPTELSSPFPYPYIEVGMVIMINKRGDQPPKWRCTFPALRKDPQITVMSVTTVTQAGTPHR
jgi:hypothetical protein